MMPAPAAVARPGFAASTSTTSAPSELAVYAHEAPTMPDPTTISRNRPHPSRAACIDGGVAFPRKRYSCGRWDRSGPGEWRRRSLRDRVAHVGGVRRAVNLGHLQIDVPVEPVEQPLACAEDHRGR